MNKANFDIDIQIADALASIAGMIYLSPIQESQKQLNQAEQMKKELIERKLANKTNPSIFEVLL